MIPIKNEIFDISKWFFPENDENHKLVAAVILELQYASFQVTVRAC